jgi:hypothetical protein
MELTQEYFDQQLKSLATKADIEELVRMVNDNFDDMRTRLDVTDRVQTLEQVMHKSLLGWKRHYISSSRSETSKRAECIFLLFCVANGPKLV